MILPEIDLPEGNNPTARQYNCVAERINELFSSGIGTPGWRKAYYFHSVLRQMFNPGAAGTFTYAREDQAWYTILPIEYADRSQLSGANFVYDVTAGLNKHNPLIIYHYGFSQSSPSTTIESETERINKSIDSGLFDSEGHILDGLTPGWDDLKRARGTTKIENGEHIVDQPLAAFYHYARKHLLLADRIGELYAYSKAFGGHILTDIDTSGSAAAVSSPAINNASASNVSGVAGKTYNPGLWGHEEGEQYGDMARAYISTYRGQRRSKRGRYDIADTALDVDAMLRGRHLYTPVPGGKADVTIEGISFPAYPGSGDECPDGFRCLGLAVWSDTDDTTAKIFYNDADSATDDPDQEITIRESGRENAVVTYDIPDGVTKITVTGASCEVYQTIPQQVTEHDILYWLRATGFEPGADNHILSRQFQWGESLNHETKTAESSLFENAVYWAWRDDVWRQTRLLHYDEFRSYETRGDDDVLTFWDHPLALNHENAQLFRGLLPDTDPVSKLKLGYQYIVKGDGIIYDGQQLKDGHVFTANTVDFRSNDSGKIYEYTKIKHTATQHEETNQWAIEIGGRCPYVESSQSAFKEDAYPQIVGAFNNPSYIYSELATQAGASPNSQAKSFAMFLNAHPTLQDRIIRAECPRDLNLRFNDNIGPAGIRRNENWNWSIWKENNDVDDTDDDVGAQAEACLKAVYQAHRLVKKSYLIKAVTHPFKTDGTYDTNKVEIILSGRLEDEGVGADNIRTRTDRNTITDLVNFKAGSADNTNNHLLPRIGDVAPSAKKLYQNVSGDARTLKGAYLCRFFLNKLQPLAHEEEDPNSIKELTDTRAWADTMSQLDTTLRACACGFADLGLNNPLWDTGATPNIGISHQIPGSVIYHCSDWSWRHWRFPRLAQAISGNPATKELATTAPRGKIEYKILDNKDENNPGKPTHRSISYSAPGRRLTAHGVMPGNVYHPSQWAEYALAVEALHTAPFPALHLQLREWIDFLFDTNSSVSVPGLDMTGTRGIPVVAGADYTFSQLPTLSDPDGTEFTPAEFTEAIRETAAGGLAGRGNDNTLWAVSPSAGAFENLIVSDIIDVTAPPRGDVDIDTSNEIGNGEDGLVYSDITFPTLFSEENWGPGTFDMYTAGGPTGNFRRSGSLVRWRIETDEIAQTAFAQWVRDAIETGNFAVPMVREHEVGVDIVVARIVNYADLSDDDEIESVAKDTIEDVQASYGYPDGSTEAEITKIIEDNNTEVWLHVSHTLYRTECLLSAGGTIYPPSVDHTVKSQALYADIRGNPGEAIFSGGMKSATDQYFVDSDTILFLIPTRKC